MPKVRFDDREQLVSEFWKRAKNPKSPNGNPYTAAVHHVIDLMQQQEMVNMFVPEKTREREVKLVFDREGCTVTVEGVKVVSFREDMMILHKYISSEATGLRIDSNGVVKMRLES